jgi:hypothetical protein
MGQYSQPLVKVDDLDRCVTKCGEVSGVNQYVPVRHVQFGVLAVGVTDANNAD